MAEPDGIAEQDGVDRWRAGLMQLSPDKPPCPGFLADQWRAARDAAFGFCHEHARTAEAQGWSALDLFGVHEKAGAVRADCVGALSGNSTGARVVEVTADAITFANGLK